MDYRPESPGLRLNLDAGFEPARTRTHGPTCHGCAQTVRPAGQRMFFRLSQDVGFRQEHEPLLCLACFSAGPKRAAEWVSIEVRGG